MINSVCKIIYGRDRVTNVVTISRLHHFVVISYSEAHIGASGKKKLPLNRKKKLQQKQAQDD